MQDPNTNVLRQGTLSRLSHWLLTKEINNLTKNHKEILIYFDLNWFKMIS